MINSLHTTHHRHALALATDTLVPRMPILQISHIGISDLNAFKPIQRIAKASKRQPHDKTDRQRAVPTEHGNQLSP